MFEGLAPDLGPRIALAVGGVALAFIVLVAVLVFLKRRNSPLFIKGGRSREHRLHVLDAAAVDAKRRLVLIRRDDTEHLIMIGGPTDIVIETGISSQTLSASDTNQKREPAARTNAQLEAPPQSPLLQAARPLAGTAPQAAVQAPIQKERVEAPVAEPDRQQQSRAVAESQQARASALAQTPTGAKSAQQGAATPQATDVESILDMARARVLQTPPGDEERQANERRRIEAARVEQARIEAQRAESAKAEAQRLLAGRAAEAARQEAARVDAQQKLDAQQRLEAQQGLEAQRNARAAAAASVSVTEPPSLAQQPGDVQQNRPENTQRNDALASDFARFLENELEAGGILSEGPAPVVQGEQRDFTTTTPLTGANPAPSAEQDMARRLAEAQLNRKTDPSV